MATGESDKRESTEDDHLEDRNNSKSTEGLEPGDQSTSDENSNSEKKSSDDASEDKPTQLTAWSKLWMKMKFKVSGDKCTSDSASDSSQEKKQQDQAEANNRRDEEQPDNYESIDQGQMNDDSEVDGERSYGNPLGTKAEEDQRATMDLQTLYREQAKEKHKLEMELLRNKRELIDIEKEVLSLEKEKIQRDLRMALVHHSDSVVLP